MMDDGRIHHDVMTRTKTLAAGLVLATLGLGMLACERTPPANAPGVTVVERLPAKISTDSPAAVAPVGGDAVVLSEDLKHRCEMPKSTDAPKFAFDSPVLGAVGREPLDALARCLTVGSLHGQRIQLVGRADPRGEVEYNMGLGSNRAEAVAAYLRSLGVPTEQIVVTSRGELDAIGVDEVTWALDRRVDVASQPPS